MIDDRTLCLCGHDEFQHYHNDPRVDDCCTGDYAMCRCEKFEPLLEEGEYVDG